MEGLPKKYAKMGFKAGWKAYKASKNQRKASKPAKQKSQVGRRMKKQTGFKIVKGVAYGAALALPGVASYENYKTYVYNGDKKASAIAAGKAYMGIDAQTGEFSFAIATQMYTPVAVVMAADFITSKLGLQRRLATALNGLMG